MSTSFSSPTRTGSPTPDARAQPRSPPQPPLSLLWRLRSHASGPGLAATRPPRAGHRRLIQDPWHVELVFVTLILHRGDQPSAPQHKAMSRARPGIHSPLPCWSEGARADHERRTRRTDGLRWLCFHRRHVDAISKAISLAHPAGLLRALSKSHAGTAQHRTQHLLGVASPCWRKRERRAARGMLDGDGPASFCACISSVVSSRVRIASASKQSL